MTENQSEINKICGAHVKEVISESGLTQEQFAMQIMFKSPVQLSYIVTGKRPLPLDDARTIVKKYPHIRLDWLLGQCPYKTEEESISAICGNDYERHEHYARLIELHHYHISEYVKPDAQIMTVIKAPDGTERYMETSEYFRLINSFDDFIEGQLMLQCKKPQDGSKEYWR